MATQPEVAAPPAAGPGGDDRGRGGGCPSADCSCDPGEGTGPSSAAPFLRGAVARAARNQPAARGKGQAGTAGRPRPGTRNPEPEAQAAYRIKAKEVMAT